MEETTGPMNEKKITWNSLNRKQKRGVVAIYKKLKRRAPNAPDRILMKTAYEKYMGV
jgi:hypothetical protein